ncbi:MAG: hypothetical protein JJU11_07540, partial [Candidatus Sumerlaeia bacterium]|nr:hypothetical protein [Candidatus Sumerlaeia bacterium]
SDGAARAAQIAGIGNNAGKGVHGFQIGGLANLSGDRVNGAQIAGFTSEADGPLNGVQLSGLFNEAADTVSGLQLSAIFNNTDGALRGGQLTGLVNNTEGTVEGLQIGAISNSSSGESVTGGQIAGLANAAGSGSRVFQASIWNIIGPESNAIQIGAIGNRERVTPPRGSDSDEENSTEAVQADNKPSTVVQVSSIYNNTGTTNDSRGVMISGIYNRAGNAFSGLQLGLLNLTEEVRGVQLGLVNDSDELRGVQLGLINIVDGSFRFPLINVSWRSNGDE